MCSVFEFLDMDSFQGDLTDILRGTGGGEHVSSSPGQPERNWPPPPPQRSDLHVDFPSAGFGDPFMNMTDPLLQELNVVSSSGYFSGGGSGGGFSSDNISSSSSCSNNNHNNNNNNFMVPKVFDDDHIKNQCSVFPRIRISPHNIVHDASPCNSPVVSAAFVAASPPTGIIGKYPAVGNDMINVDATNSPRNCLNGNNTCSSQLQISSPRNLGLKRRKSQAKKVVCIPAPAAANSRSSGEVVPSDLWAWRKYGQKPIKGSPYPRCSSSKGCSARKQVERSRADPNMLVITYTSEHNHPWPTQRNALAGSTRSTSHSSSKSPNANATSSRVATKDEPKPDTHSPAANPAVKEEIRDECQDMDFDVDDSNIQSYRPDVSSEVHHNSDDFFADLDELDGDDPLSLLLSQGFSSVSGSAAGDGVRKNETASSDAFGDFCFDWSVNRNDDNTTSFEDGDDSNSKSL
ncbi:PREDICTED: probable WRKY transcription factor 14 isoform X2 [Tarenaya hassleriana]|uniref:probable WRKY transcription factor 14 isoform X2 n=1 Tax=Tarenaya hassleriana TaxID=28532 RepID=UPI0008FD6FA5|nr:PREDICTED: probable WRKY transcription factor 14 isoform X2 [Tarenaya hassleriana]